MFKTIKRKYFVIVIVLIFLIIFISIFFILLKKFSVQSKQIDSSFVLKQINIAPIEAEAKIGSLYKDYDWRIIIPKINLDAPILEGTDSSTLRRGVGHFEDSGIDNGNICLAAHNRGYKYNYFQDIKELQIGDLITYQIHDKKMQFRVVSNKVIEETDISVIQNTTENRLTLITCEVDKREYRRCIQADEVM